MITVAWLSKLRWLELAGDKQQMSWERFGNQVQ